MTEVKAASYDFDQEDLEVYRKFANSLSNISSAIYDDAKYETDIDEIVRKLEMCYQNSILEEYIQNTSKIISPFVNGGYKYFSKEQFPVYVLGDFVKLVKVSSPEQKRIILNHLWERLDQIEKIPNPAFDDLPF